MATSAAPFTASNAPNAHDDVPEPDPPSLGSTLSSPVRSSTPQYPTHFSYTQRQLGCTPYRERSERAGQLGQGTTPAKKITESRAVPGARTANTRRRATFDSVCGRPQLTSSSATEARSPI